MERAAAALPGRDDDVEAVSRQDAHGRVVHVAEQLGHDAADEEPDAPAPLADRGHERRERRAIGAGRDARQQRGTLAQRRRREPERDAVEADIERLRGGS